MKLSEWREIAATRGQGMHMSITCPLCLKAIGLRPNQGTHFCQHEYIPLASRIASHGLEEDTKIPAMYGVNPRVD